MVNATSYQLAEASGGSTFFLWIALLAIWTMLSRWRHPEEHVSADDFDHAKIIGRRRSRRITWTFVALGLAWPLLGMLAGYLIYS